MWGIFITNFSGLRSKRILNILKMAALVIVKQNFNEHDLIHFINYVASKLNWYQKVDHLEWMLIVGWVYSCQTFFWNLPTDLCKVIAKVIKKFCTEKVPHRNLELFLAYYWKCSLWAHGKDVFSSVGSMQVCVGHDGGCEAVVNAMHFIFEEECFRSRYKHKLTY